MDFEIQRAVALLNHLLNLASLETSDVDQGDLDALVDELLPPAMLDAQRLTADWVRGKEEQALRIVEAQKKAESDVIEAEEQAEKDAVQEELDQAQRDERLREGVS